MADQPTPVHVSAFEVINVIGRMQVGDDDAITAVTVAIQVQGHVLGESDRPVDVPFLFDRGSIPALIEGLVKAYNNADRDLAEFLETGDIKGSVTPDWAQGHGAE